MAGNVLNVIAENGSGRLLEAFNSTGQGAIRRLVFGDTLPVNFRYVEPRTNGGQVNPWQDIDLSGYDVRVGIGERGSDPVAFTTLEDALPSAAVVATMVREGDTDLSEIQSIAIAPVAIGGVYTLQITGDTEETAPIDFDATAAEIQTALEALTDIGAGNVTVTGEYPLYRVTLAASLGEVGLLVGDDSGLIVPVGVSGELDLNTEELDTLLGADDSIEVYFEVELMDQITSARQTVLQVPVTVVRDVIPSDATSPAPIGSINEMVDGIAQPQSVVDNAAKLALTNVRPGQRVRVIDERKRIEVYLGPLEVGGPATEANWIALTNTLPLTVGNESGGALTINGIEVADGQVLGVGWVDPTSISIADGPHSLTIASMETLYGTASVQVFSTPIAVNVQDRLALPHPCPPRLPVKILIE